MPLPPPIAVQLYSLREEAQTNFADVIARVGAAGFVGVELAGFNGLSPARFAELAADAGLVVSSVHIGSTAPDAVKATLDDLAVIGCSTAVVAFLSAVIVMEIAGPILAQWGLKLAGETAPLEEVGVATGRHTARAPGA